MKVLAAIDGSSFSNFVVRELCLRRWPDDSIVRLITVLDSNAGQYSDAYQGAEQCLESIFSQLSQIHTNIKFIPEIHYGHDAGKTLIQLANDWHAELFIVAAHEKGNLHRFLLGSVSECVLDHGMIPVIVAKEEPLTAQHDTVNILLPTDNSVFSVEAMEWFLRQGWTKPVNLKLMTVLPSLSEKYSTEEDTEKAMEMLSHQQKLKDEVIASFQQWGAHFQKHSAPASVHFQIREGIPQDEIILEAQEWSANLIVMGSHGRTGLKGYLIGSVARAVSHKAPCSVEIVRLPDFAEYYHNWQSVDKKTRFEDLKKRGDFDMPHVMGSNW